MRRFTAINDNAVAPAESQAFTYDDAQRLKSATGIYGTLAWAYDLVGNRTAETRTPPGGSAATQDYTYFAGSNRLQSVKQGTTTLRAFLYDAAGNMIRDTRGAGDPYHVGYSRSGWQLLINLGTAGLSRYVYDGRNRLGVRFLFGPPAATQHLLHDADDRVIAETDGSGPAGTKREYVWLGSMPVAVIDRTVTPAKTYFVHADHLDRPVMMTDASKAVVWKALYEPFGTVHAITGSAALDMGFPGQWFQLEAGLAYNWHRQYDSTVGRYTQVDPMNLLAQGVPRFETRQKPFAVTAPAEDTPVFIGGSTPPLDAALARLRGAAGITAPMRRGDGRIGGLADLMPELRVAISAPPSSIIAALAGCSSTGQAYTAMLRRRRFAGQIRKDSLALRASRG